MNITLFDAANTVREYISDFDEETGELSTAYAESRELFEKKGGACVAYALEEAAAIDAAYMMIKQMKERIDARKDRLSRFHKYIADCMKAAGIKSIGFEEVAKATLYEGRDESVEIDDGAKFPESLCADPKPPLPSKTKIKAAILAGEPVSGARIIKKDRLTIK